MPPTVGLGEIHREPGDSKVGYVPRADNAVARGRVKVTAQRTTAAALGSRNDRGFARGSALGRTRATVRDLGDAPIRFGDDLGGDATTEQVTIRCIDSS